jgi:hypothetical protein
VWDMLNNHKKFPISPTTYLEVPESNSDLVKTPLSGAIISFRLSHVCNINLQFISVLSDVTT